jgi:pyridoxamine 5'-phosphate oxidase
MITSMPDTWVTSLKSAADAGKGPLVATLATVSEAATPEARSVVVRHVGDDGTLTFTSDARSTKDGQMLARPRVVLVFWLPESRLQFRVAGSARLRSADSVERLEAWKKMSDSARAVFAWPPPGLRRGEDGAFPARIGADAAPLGSFDVWVVSPDSVDALDLRQHPHLRQRWNVADGHWSAETVNP